MFVALTTQGLPLASVLLEKTVLGFPPQPPIAHFKMLLPLSQ
jgi:hypothetical protein